MVKALCLYTTGPMTEVAFVATCCHLLPTTVNYYHLLPAVVSIIEDSDIILICTGLLSGLISAEVRMVSLLSRTNFFFNLCPLSSE